MRHAFLLLATCACACAVWSADAPVVRPTPLPGPGAMPPRSLPSIEVELVAIDSAAPAAGLARWAELAADGFRIDQVVAAGGTQHLYLSRMQLTPSAQHRLPAAVEADPALAAATRAKVEAILAARRQARPTRMPAPPSGDHAAPAGAEPAAPAAPAQP